MICQMCFESEAMESSTVCEKCSDSMIDKGFEIKCLNCGSTDCRIDEMGTYNYEEEWEGWGTFEITCRKCGQCQ